MLSVNDVYGGTYRYFTRVAPVNGVAVDFIDLNDPEVIKQHIKSNTRVFSFSGGCLLLMSLACCR